MSTEQNRLKRKSPPTVEPRFPDAQPDQWRDGDLVWVGIGLAVLSASLVLLLLWWIF